MNKRLYVGVNTKILYYLSKGDKEKNENKKCSEYIYIYKLFIQINCFNYKFVYNFNIVNISTPNAIL